MAGIPESQSSSTPKLKRSRNGCNECRRLHRRCDEEKPECLNCREAGKECSYQKPLSWGGRPFRKSTFGHALGSGVVEIPIADSEEDAPYSRSFVYGQVEGSGSATTVNRGLKIESRPRSAPTIPLFEPDDSSSSSQPGPSAVPSSSIQWLSQHHRMLFHHFITSTLNIFTRDTAVQDELRSAFVPMAVDTNHGFSLLAAILSLASTHRMNLGVHRDMVEIEYWRDMSVGHLRRPAMQEHNSTKGVFVSTALLLCIRDVISDAEKPSSWKLHLHGAFTVFTASEDDTILAKRPICRLLQKLARSLQIRSLLPASQSPPCPGDVEKRPLGGEYEVLGLPKECSGIFQDIRTLSLEKNALKKIESNSGSTNMQRLWSDLRGQCLELIVRHKTVCEATAATVKDERESKLYKLYSYVVLVQAYSSILDLSTTDSGLRGTVEAAMSTLRHVEAMRNSRIEAHLTFSLFTIGALIQSESDRKLVTSLLARIAVEHGKGNAGLSKTFLEQLWKKIDAENRPVMQTDVNALMAEKGWDLSLW